MPARSSRLISRSSSDELGIGERQLRADALQRLVEAEARLDADDEQVEHVGERQPDAVRAALGDPRQHHARQDVAEAEAAERERDVRLEDDRRGEEREQPERERDADAEEDRQRLVAAVAGLHQAQPQVAHLLRRLRRLLAEPLQRGDEALEPRLLLVRLAAERQLFEPAVDRDGAGRQERVRRRRDERGPEHEGQQRQHHRHGYTSILTTCLIQMYPTTA